MSDGASSASGLRAFRPGVNRAARPARPAFEVGSVGQQLVLLGALGPAALGILVYGFLSRRSRAALVRAAALASGLGVCMSVGAILTDSAPYLSRLVMSGSILLLVASLDVWRAGEGRHVLLHLANGLIFSLAAYFAAMGAHPEFFESNWLDLAPYATPAFDTLLFGQISVNLAYVLVWPLLLPIRQLFSGLFLSRTSPAVIPEDIGAREELVVFSALLGFGSISRLWNFAHGVYLYTQGTALPSSASSLLAQFERLYYLGWLFGLAQVFSGKRSAKSRMGALSIALAVAEFAYQVLSGSKGRFFYFVIQPVALVYLLTRRKVSNAFVTSFFVTGLVSWLVVYPMLTTYRDEVGAASPQGISQAAQTLAAQSSQSRDDETYVDNVLTPIRKSNKAEFVVALTSISRFGPTSDSANFWKRLFMFWVPRFLWPEKPAALDANVIGRLTGRITPDDTTTSVVLTGPGELLVYFGNWGALLLGLGALVLRAAESIFSPWMKRTTFRIAAFAAFVDASTSWVAGQFEASLTGWVLQVLVMGGVIALARLAASDARARANRAPSRRTAPLRAN